jgi:HEAT repeat protein
MRAVCIDCWCEVPLDQSVCPNCGATIDSDSPSYERLLFWALKSSTPEHRAQICKILGLRGYRSAVPHLIERINDHNVAVGIAALRALGAIGDDSAIPVIEKALSSESLPVRAAAREALREMGVDGHESNPTAD